MIAVILTFEYLKKEAFEGGPLLILRRRLGQDEAEGV